MPVGAPMRLAPLLVALALAGCLAPLEDRLRAGDVEPPRWSVGDWWTYELSSEVYQTAANVTVVVANVTSEGYILGVPDGDDVTFALLQHLPALGPVREDLAWDVHETRFEPVKFPLEDDLTWDTTWITASVRLTARIDEANGTWTITNEGFENDSRMRYDITYDPDVGAITRFVRTGVGADTRVRQSLELVANGTGFDRPVRTFGTQQVALLESRTQGFVSPGGAAPPNPTFVPPTGTDTLLVACLAGGQPGQYHAEVRSPQGVVCQLDVTIQPGDAVQRAQALEVPVEDGQWEARLAAIGQGSSVAEVLAYSTDVVTVR
jgi:hypothetical protein